MAQVPFQFSSVWMPLLHLLSSLFDSILFIHNYLYHVFLPQFCFILIKIKYSIISSHALYFYFICIFFHLPVKAVQSITISIKIVDVLRLQLFHCSLGCYLAALFDILYSFLIFGVDSSRLIFIGLNINYMFLLYPRTSSLTYHPQIISINDDCCQASPPVHELLP